MRKAVCDLIAHPHEEEGAGGEGEDCEELEGEAGVGDEGDAVVLGDGALDAL